MKIVMATVHPAVVGQEQILRCAFVAHLPEEIRKAIGTLSANVHPEMPTASNIYQREGKATRRARIDLGVGHPTSCDEIVGAIELKTLTQFGELWFRKQLEKLNSTPKGLMFSGIAGDFQKLLDPKVPKDAFRYSWVVTKKCGLARPEQIARWAKSLLGPVEQRLTLEGFEQSFDTTMDSLRWRWSNGSALNLAWYWPKERSPEQFEPVWATGVADS
jgi:hypothetical protein